MAQINERRFDKEKSCVCCTAGLYIHHYAVDRIVSFLDIPVCGRQVVDLKVCNLQSSMFEMNNVMEQLMLLLRQLLPPNKAQTKLAKTGCRCTSHK